MTTLQRRLRSLLFAPGNEQRKLNKAPTLDADAIVFDLEDAVPQSQKETARAQVHAALNRRHDLPIMVRVNPADTGFLGDDLDAAITPHTAGIVLPKVEHPDQLIEVARRIGDLEDARSLASDTIRILALIETATGIQSAGAISRTSGARLERTILGTVDLAADLNLPVGQRNSTLEYAAAGLVIAARAAGLAAPLDGPYTHLDDPNGYREDCRRSAAAGMVGRVVLHPGQLAAAHDAYQNTETLDWHRRVVAAFEEAEQAGVASLRLDDEFIDYPVYAASRRVIEQADAVIEHG